MIIQEFENTGSYHKTQMDCSSPPTILPRSYSLIFWAVLSPQRCPLREKVWEWWQGYWRSDEVALKYKFQTGARRW